MKKILLTSLTLLLAFIAFPPTSAQAQAPPCSNRWFEVRPGSLAPGPLITPGMHRIWLGKKDPRTGTISNWTSFGPFQVIADSKYLAIIRNEAVSNILRNDASLNMYNSPGKNVAAMYYQNDASSNSWFAICTQLVAGAQAPAPPPPPNGSGANEVKVFDNNNIYAVGNRPTQPTQFTIAKPYVITSILNYHWNGGRGAMPGTISLRSNDGSTFGPWPVIATAGQGNAPNVYWVCQPNVTLAAGTYTIIDSNPATWSQNSASFGSGMSVVKGYPVGAALQGATVTAIFENRSSDSVHIFAAGETFGPRNRLTPGETREVQVSIPSDGRIMFYAGRDGQVLATKIWDGDPEHVDRFPRVIFDGSRLIVTTSLR